MDTLLVKIFATALTLSQVTTAPDALKTRFDPIADQAQVVALLRAGCTHMRKVLEIEDLNLDDLLATAMEDPDMAAGDNAAFQGIKFSDLQSAYRQFCTDEKVPDWGFDARAVIELYDQTVADLPDPARLKGINPSGATVILDRKGARFTEVFDGEQRRISVPLADIPIYVRNAFVAAEDKRFYEHKGIDERGLIRAVLSDMGKSGHPQGASTITQQVVKNLLVGDEVSYERKIREIILTSQVERMLSKDEILALYLNTIYLGRGSWGVEMAARSYFGKSAKDLTLSEAALLAGLPKGPSYFSPDRYPERMRERRAYVLGRMREDGVITAEEAAAAGAEMPALVAYERPRRDFGFHFADQVGREARTLAASNGLISKSYTVHSTLDVPLQRSVEEALQEGLSRYERDNDRVHFSGPEANLGAAIARLESEPKKTDPKTDPKTAAKIEARTDARTEIKTDARPAWQRALASARLPLYDVHWTPAVVVEARGADGRGAERDGGRKSGGALRVGLADGRILPLTGDAIAVRRNIKLYDVVFVRVGAGKNARAELRVRPQVQGAALVLENRTGRILAMTGGFSYPLSQLNRATQAQRQPGSAIKPLSYLAALENGLQPNTLIADEPITFPPIGGRGQEWAPKNYEGGGSGIITLRKALEDSRNLATVHLLQGGIEAKPEQSLDRLCGLALDLKIYRDCAKYYPFMLGAQPVRPVDLAAFYATIANEGVHPSPHVVESIEQDGKTYGGETPPPAAVSASDRAAFYQLKTMLQGVLQRGTAHELAPLAPYVAGKTGTTEDQNDAWFVGFTNDITIAVWVGYDNANGERRTLGDGSTGAAVAAPIFQSIVEAAWTHGWNKAPLAPPSAEAAADLSCKSVDPETGARRRHASSAECLRLDAKGKPIEARYRLVSRDSGASRHSAYDSGNRSFGTWGYGDGYSSYGSSRYWGGYASPNRYGGGSRDIPEGWHREEPSGWQPPRSGFWSW